MDDVCMNSEVVSFLEENKTVFDSTCCTKATPSIDSLFNQFCSSSPDMSENNLVTAVPKTDCQAAAAIEDHVKRLYEQTVFG